MGRESFRRDARRGGRPDDHRLPARRDPDPSGHRHPAAQSDRSDRARLPARRLRPPPRTRAGGTSGERRATAARHPGRVRNGPGRGSEIVKPVMLKEILGYEQYEILRPRLRPLFIAEKERRRLAVGAHLSLLFENGATVWYQVAE